MYDFPYMLRYIPSSYVMALIFLCIKKCLFIILLMLLHKYSEENEHCNELQTYS